METNTILLLSMLTFTAAFVQRTIGFGFGIFIMSWLIYLLPSYGEATTLSGSLAMITSLFLTLRYWKLIEWRKMLPILLTFLIISAGAVLLISQLETTTLKRILGVTLILVALYFWIFGGKVSIRPTLSAQIGLGTLSGLMGGMFGMQGPPAVIYFLSISTTKETYTAVAQTYFLIGNLVMTLYRAHCGFLTEEVKTAWCIALPTVLLGTWIGSKVFNRLSLPILRKIVYAFIGISGIVALIG